MVRFTLIRFCSTANTLTHTLPTYLSEHHRVVTKKSKYFVDAFKLNVQGGNGGSGLHAFGGRGGNGGNVRFKCDPRMESLKQLKVKVNKLMNQYKNLQAESGSNSAKYKLMGDRGHDLVIDCPPGCTLKNINGGYIGEINEQHSTVTLPIGGEGGRPENNYIGRLGAKMGVIIDLKLISDIGLVGYPNAGKSTLLKALTRAKPKIANYPFTTITPNIGVVEYADKRRISIADLPGLVKGAHLDIGLGHKFLKHVLRTKMLMFVIAAERLFTTERQDGYSPIEILLTLLKEIELYDDTILNKPALVVFTKSDRDNAKDFYDQFLQDLERVKQSDFSTINLPSEYLPNQLIEFDLVVPVSSKTSWNVKELQKILREQIDFHFEEELIEKGEITTFEKSVNEEKKKKSKDLIVL